jgi:hypothetical protein
LYGVYGIVLDPKFIFSLMKLQAWTLYNRGFKPPCFGAASWVLTEGLKVWWCGSVMHSQLDGV